MMGQGNDHLTVTGSLVPGPFSANGSIYTDSTDTTFNTYAQGGLTVVQGGGSAPLSVTGTFAITSTGSGSYSIVRSDQLNWADYEFVVGQQLMWNGSVFGTIAAVNGATLTVAGTLLPSSALGTGVSGDGRGLRPDDVESRRDRRQPHHGHRRRRPGPRRSAPEPHRHVHLHGQHADTHRRRLVADRRVRRRNGAAGRG